MVEDVAHFMVDCTQIAVILCQNFGGENYKVTLLLPRHTTQHCVSSQCLIVSKGVAGVSETACYLCLIGQDVGRVDQTWPQGKQNGIGLHV